MYSIEILIFGQNVSTWNPVYLNDIVGKMFDDNGKL